MHLVLEGSSHDSFNDAVQLLAVHYRRTVDYLRSFKKVPALCRMCPAVAARLHSHGFADLPLWHIGRHCSSCSPT